MFLRIYRYRKRSLEMYQSFWNTFYDLKLASYYFQFYALKARRLKATVSAICILASSAFLLQMAQSSSFQPVWVVVVFVCQLVSVLQPIFPYEKQYHAACYIYEDVNQLCAEIEAYWRTISIDTSDEDLNKQIVWFSGKYDTIEDRFATADMFPQRKKIYEKAKKNTDIYFRRFTE
ncbi:MAG: hypothetical protein IJT08_03995 [Alphaproteobacteria bacterium]|nr:hypothetical protein [Alphaproteobacteria bacterium]